MLSPHLPLRSLFGLSLLTLALCTTAGADEWRFRALGQANSSSASVLDNENLDEGYGAYVGLERQLNNRWGLEFGIGRSDLEAAQQVDIVFLGLSIFTNLEARVEWTPLTVAANFHLTPNRKVDFYIAPRIGYALVDDLEIRTNALVSDFPMFPGFPFELPFLDITVPDQLSKLAVDDTFIYGLRLGLDWPLGDSGWGLSGSVDYTAMELQFVDAGSLDLDPLSVGFGFFKSW